MTNDQINGNSKPKVLILGFGAIGSLYGFLIQRGGADLYVVARSNADIIEKYGIEIRSDKYGNHKEFKPTKVFRNSKEVLESKIKFDFILCTVKNCPEEKELGKFVKEFLPIPERNTDIKSLPAVVFLENGIDIEQEPFETLVETQQPRASLIISGVAWVGVNTRENGKVCSHGSADSIELGLFPKSSNIDEDSWREEKIKIFHDFFKNGKGTIKIVDDIRISRFSKILWNAGWGGLSLISRQPCEVLLLEENVDKSEKIVREIMLEVLSIVRACGYNEKEFSSTKVENTLHFTLSQSPRYLEKGKKSNLGDGFKPSILVDLESNRPMELTPIFGNLVKLAQQFNLQVPRIELIYTANYPSLIQSIKK